MLSILNTIHASIQQLLILASPLVFLIWIIFGFKRGKNREKEKQTTKLQLILSSIFCLITLPIAAFIGAMATDSANSSSEAEPMFWSGFWFIWTVPLLSLATTLIKRYIQKIRA